MEYFWDIQGERVHDLYPFPVTTLPEMERWLIEEWQSIPKGDICRYLLSMRYRLPKVVIIQDIHLQ